MSKATGPTPPQYTYVPPPSAPPSYQEAVGGVKPVGPFTPVAVPTTNATIVTTVVPIGRTATHMICPSCHAEIETTTRTEPGMIAYLSGFVIALLGYVGRRRRKGLRVIPMTSQRGFFDMFVKILYMNYF